MCIAGLRVNLEVVLSVIFCVEVSVPVINIKPNPNPRLEFEVCDRIRTAYIVRLVQ